MDCWVSNRVGYVYIEESFDTMFRVIGGDVQRPPPHGLWFGKIAHGRKDYNEIVYHSNIPNVTIETMVLILDSNSRMQKNLYPPKKF